MSDKFDLNCWILGDDARQVFPVEISNTKSVGSLMEAIKAKKKLAIGHIDADALTLWKVSISIDSSFKENVEEVELEDEEALPFMEKLSCIFPDQPDDEALHIVVLFPRVVELCCLICNDDASQIFPVKIAITESVGTLKEAIKDKKLALQHVDADSLTLWKVPPIRIDGSFQENLKKVELKDEETLSPVQRIFRIFPRRPQDGLLHLIIQSPGPATDRKRKREDPGRSSPLFI
ncbi:uncharacterized protein EI90DRAFT_2937713 [Cantharellus anzutake]|uniref:uncharacterized protein n=1 Tax=Cantharellus anzutake TaxID=1750568 RepID=UPI0019053628|nr:uncharacterized protein EI90DRAFT_2937713 [Cantharellus anzutake]KAF8321998.1 hypothetical protein EI90DRAFT_2937713 [Cantharellus anzutake]